MACMAAACLARRELKSGDRAREYCCESRYDGDDEAYGPAAELIDLLRPSRS